MKTAIQLYSLREVIAEALPETLDALGAMGYEGVEFAGTYGRTAAELRLMLDRAHLACAGAHVSLGELSAENFSATAERYRALGTDRLIVPAAPLDDLAALIDELNAIHDRARAAGMKAGFHNHAREFEPIGHSNAFEQIFEQTPPDFLVQLDIGWAVSAGQDAAALLERYAERVETVHVKEFRPGDMSVIVGEGDVPWRPVFDALRTLPRLEWLIVEQEQHAVDPMESARRCRVNLLALRGGSLN